MADPKYADLPGIATDQPDTYETSSDRGQDTDEDSLESEESETLHLSSLSWLGELEVGGQHETLTQRFTRLRCEVTELAEDLDSLTESAREGSLTGLQRQVIQLHQQLEGCPLPEADSSAFVTSMNQKAALSQLAAQIKSIAPVSEENMGTVGAFELYVRGNEIGEAANLTRLDRQLARLESLVGSRGPELRTVLSAETDGLPLDAAVQLLDQRRYTHSGQHLTQVEGRLAALNNRLDALSQQKTLVQRAKSAAQVAAIYDSLESRSGMMAVLPEVAARLTDLAQLQQGADGWGPRLVDSASQQEVAKKLIVENRIQLVATQRQISEGLAGILDKVAKMQGNLQALAV